MTRSELTRTNDESSGFSLGAPIVWVDAHVQIFIISRVLKLNTFECRIVILSFFGKHPIGVETFRFIVSDK